MVLLQIADFTVGFWLRGITPKEQFVQLLTWQGNIYAALLALFAIMLVAGECLISVGMRTLPDLREPWSVNTGRRLDILNVFAQGVRVHRAIV